MRTMRVIGVLWAMCLVVPGSLPAAESAESGETASQRLARVLAAQPEETRARYAARHPQETLEFFGIVPGMTVVEVLPGGGWYSKILLEHLGSEGRLVGADYPIDMLAKLGFYEGERLEKKKRWVETWTAEAEGWRVEGSAAVSAFVLGAMPDELAGSADAVLFIRALHNLARMEDDGGYLTAALADAHRVLKPGGTLGVVQHEARPEMPDAWAGGAAGYLKRAALVARIEQAGFELVGESDVNANPKDVPTTDDFVWRLPPSYANARDDAAKRAAADAIGESNRMTLRFRKKE